MTTAALQTTTTTTQHEHLLQLLTLQALDQCVKAISSDPKDRIA